MSLMKWTGKKIKKLSVWDFALMKTALILFGIIIGAYIAGFTRQNIWWFIGVFVVSYAILFYKIFKK